jgi:hypothetical protein
MATKEMPDAQFLRCFDETLAIDQSQILRKVFEFRSKVHRPENGEARMPGPEQLRLHFHEGNPLDIGLTLTPEPPQKRAPMMRRRQRQVSHDDPERLSQDEGGNTLPYLPVIMENFVESDTTGAAEAPQLLVVTIMVSGQEVDLCWHVEPPQESRPPPRIVPSVSGLGGNEVARRFKRGDISPVGQIPSNQDGIQGLLLVRRAGNSFEQRKPCGLGVSLDEPSRTVTLKELPATLNEVGALRHMQVGDVENPEAFCHAEV